MTDIVDKATRSRMMSGIRCTDTRPELALRRSLHALGFRFRLHSRNVPGKPDLILPKYRAAILVHGCFWHRHRGCRYTTTPSTRPDFWAAKFEANINRDRVVKDALQQSGYRQATVWECALRKPDLVAQSTELLSTWLTSDSQQIEIGVGDL